jgi:hypothetical protein
MMAPKLRTQLDTAEVDRQITELVVVGVEEGHLLMPMGRVGGIVDVEAQ